MDSNGSHGVLDGLPKWARIVSVLGVPTLFALGFAWLLASGVPTDVKDAKQAAADTRALMQEHMQQQYRMERLLVRICVNSATSTEERNACWAEHTR